ncbi:MBL fold metallo-hydrolase [Vibrio makurazakiensis]|uniref:MBL fold metallo-hydrolase n=1 Tax=Vibrio makurazakiensis TaxID=2910250 RepID=UPI003D123721
MRKYLLPFVGVLAMTASVTTYSRLNTENQALPKKFVNSELEYKSGMSDIFSIIKAYMTVKRENPVPTFELPIAAMNAEQLTSEKEDVLYRLGHSSVIMKLDGKLVMADPVFSERASPVQWMGPKRFHPTPIGLEDLPDIDVVVISHDHYDHLDKASVKILAEKVGTFIVPLRVGAYLKKWGVKEEQVIELDWWESTTIDDIAYTLTPTQHFSGRGLMDRDETLWGSWVITSKQANVFFSGDSGYFSGFKEIGERYGPFDLTMVETGAYNSLWADIHMFPDQSVQAHIDLQGKVMMPIHNSTFDLSMHDWQEPLEKAYQISQDKNVTLTTPVIGERLLISEPENTGKWWNQG